MSNHDDSCEAQEPGGSCCCVYRAEIERLRVELLYRDTELRAKADEIDRLRQKLTNPCYTALWDETEKNALLAKEIERLREARTELVTALHDIASHFENALYAFRDDTETRKKAEGDIAHAMKIAARHNHNGREALGDE